MGQYLQRKRFRPDPHDHNTRSVLRNAKSICVQKCGLNNTYGMVECIPDVFENFSIFPIFGPFSLKIPLTFSNRNALGLSNSITLTISMKWWFVGMSFLSNLCVRRCPIRKILDKADHHRSGQPPRLFDDGKQCFVDYLFRDCRSNVTIKPQCIRKIRRMNLCIFV